jgi:dTDP-4-dehydrorhamnose reductase
LKVLVTGSSGQVGRAVAAAAPADAVMTLVSHRDLDITSRSDVLNIVERVRPDLIINAAAYTAVDQAEQEPEVAEAANVRGPENLAAAAREINAQLFHLSTDFVFDGNQSTAYTPDAPTNPLSAYGRTKLLGETRVLAVHSCRSLILRTAWVYAAQGKNFVLTMLRLMKERGAVRVVTDQIGTPTSASSIARVLWALAGVEGTSGVLHWTDAGVASWYDFAVAIAEEATALRILTSPVSVTPILTSDYPTIASRPRFSLLDTSETQARSRQSPLHWRVQLRATLAEIGHA